MKYGFIYITINKVNNMKYIGKCVYNRKNDWTKYLGSGVYLKRAISKYGKENFCKIIIDECSSEEELREVEEYYINQFNAVKSKDFYNIKETSIRGDTFTNNPNKEYTRKLKSINAKGKNNPMYGKAKTDKMIESVKKANSRPIEIDGVRYSSTSEASKILGINGTTIGYRLDTKTFPTYIRLYTKCATTIETERENVEVE